MKYVKTVLGNQRGFSAISTMAMMGIMAYGFTVYVDGMNRTNSFMKYQAAAENVVSLLRSDSDEFCLSNGMAAVDLNAASDADRLIGTATPLQIFSSSPSPLTLTSDPAISDAQIQFRNAGIPTTTTPDTQVLIQGNLRVTMNDPNVVISKPVAFVTTVANVGGEMRSTGCRTASSVDQWQRACEVHGATVEALGNGNYICQMTDSFGVIRVSGQQPTFNTTLQGYVNGGLKGIENEYNFEQLSQAVFRVSNAVQALQTHLVATDGANPQLTTASVEVAAASAHLVNYLNLQAVLTADPVIQDLKNAQTSLALEYHTVLTDLRGGGSGGEIIIQSGSGTGYSAGFNTFTSTYTSGGSSPLGGL